MTARRTRFTGYLHTGESAINRGLAKRLKDLEKERERRNRAAREDDLQFSLDFLSTSRKVFRMIDKDDSGTLEKQEVIDAVSADKKVINFLVNCGEPNLQGGTRTPRMRRLYKCCGPRTCPWCSSRPK